jgi:uncharacterized SAM-binding protein YcdF (DUF218 family)
VIATAVAKSKFHPVRWILVLVVVGTMGFLLYISRQIMHEARVDEEHAADAIVVFGAAEYVGRPSPVLRARLDHAYNLFERSMAPVIITTGGAGNDPHFSEGQVGRDYLESRGVPDAKLIAETQGGDTEQSARRVAVILHANGMQSCLLVSDAYHMFRAKQMMAAQGITVYISPRPGSIPKTVVGRYVAALRESVSYLLYRAHVT